MGRALEHHGGTTSPGECFSCRTRRGSPSRGSRRRAVVLRCWPPMPTVSVPSMSSRRASARAAFRRTSTRGAWRGPTRRAQWGSCPFWSPTCPRAPQGCSRPPWAPRSRGPFMPVPMPPPATNGKAVGSMVCGAARDHDDGADRAFRRSILGHAARAEMRRTGEGGEGFALAGLILGWLSVGRLGRSSSLCWSCSRCRRAADGGAPPGVRRGRWTRFGGRFRRCGRPVPKPPPAHLF